MVVAHYIHCSNSPLSLSLRGSLQSFLGNQDVGDSLDAVEALLKKHEDFEKSLAAQEEKVKAVDDMASRLRKGTHYAAADIDSRRREVRGMAAGVHVYMKRDHCGARQASVDSCFSLTLYFLLIPYFSLTLCMLYLLTS